MGRHIALCLFAAACQVVSVPCEPFDSGCNPLVVSILALKAPRDPEARLILMSPATGSMELFDISARSGQPISKGTSGGPTNLFIVRTVGSLGVIQDSTSVSLVESQSGTLVLRNTVNEAGGLYHGLLDKERRLYYVTTNTAMSMFVYGIRDDRPEKIQTTALGTSFFTQIALHPDRRFIYLANTGAVELSHYSLNADGTLGSPVANMTPPVNVEALTVEPGGRFLYLLNGTTLHTLNIGSDGSLTDPGLSTANVANGSARFFYSSSGRHMYIYSDAGLVTCEITANGALLTRSVLSPPRGDNSAGAYKAFSGMEVDFSKNFFFLASVSPAGLYTGAFDPQTELPVLHGVIASTAVPAAVGYFTF